MSERTNIRISDYKKTAKHAFKYGRKLSNFTGELYEYLLSKYVKSSHYSLRVYDNIIYIFDTLLGRLITVYPIPIEFLPVSRFINYDSLPTLIAIRFPDGHYEYVMEGKSLTREIELALEFRTKQSAINYYKNDGSLSVLERQGCEVVYIS